MRTHGAFLIGFGAAALLLCCGRARAQVPSKAKASVSARTISVTSPRPIAAAMDVIEKRYGVAIDYSDPVYASTQDTQLLYTAHCALCSVANPGRKSKRNRSTVPAMGPHDVHLLSPELIPRIRTLKLRYLEASEPLRVAPYFKCTVTTIGCPLVDAAPVGGITALIQRVLARFAAGGGSVFGVRKTATRYGPRWDVYPVKARNALGTFVTQTDYLSATVRLPASTPMGGVMEAVARQLTQKWGLKFEPGPVPPPADVPFPKGTIGHPTIMSARQALLSLAEPINATIRMLYAPDMAGYAISIGAMPYRQPPRPPTPRAVPARMVPAHPFPLGLWMSGRNSPRLIPRIQGALAKAGYLHTPASNKWDANAVNALRGFQIAHGLRPTGEFDNKTAAALLPFLPMVPAHLVPAKPAMDLQLAYWLGSTPDGRKEIAEALTKAGFYNGPISSKPNNSAAEAALKAFQKANGLQPNGWFTYKTAQKLAPYLSKAK